MLSSSTKLRSVVDEGSLNEINILINSKTTNRTTNDPG